ncbi:MAG: alpha/beta hydrolase [Acidobacteriaceae bacterium]
MQASSILDLPPVAADKRIHYGADANQFADLYLPRSGQHPRPILMNIHGGYWKARYDLTHASRFCRELANGGVAVCCIEYRRVGNVGGGWPGTFEDVLSAWNALGRIASEHSLDFDPHVSGVIGHSAGGQLALALASRKLAIRPKVALSLAGVVDLQRAWELHLSGDAVVKFLGGNPDQAPEHYAEADPMRLRIDIPQVLFHGVPDDAVPVALSREYATTKMKSGERVEYRESKTAGHFEWIDPRTTEFSNVLSFVRAGLATSKTPSAA